jgi:hypothetical protein
VEVIVTIFIAAGIIAIAAVLFGGWLVYVLVRAVAMLIGGIVRLFVPSRMRSRNAGGAYCRHVNCRASNAEHARFCRRCGRTLAASERLPTKHAAIW